MKYLAFAFAAIVGIPAMTIMGVLLPKIRNLLFSMMIFSVMLGAKVSINFMSMETYRGPARGFEVTVTDLICIALIFILIITKPRRIIWVPKTFGMCAIFFLFSVINVVGSSEPIYGYFVLFQLFRTALLYWCTINFIVCEEAEQSVMSALWLGLVLTGLLMLFLAFKQKYLDGIYRIPAFFDHSNTVPTFLLMPLCVLLVWGMADKRLSFIQYVLSMFASLGMIFAIFATGSRSGYVVTAGSVVAALIIVNFRKRKVDSAAFKIRLSTLVMLIAMAIGGIMVIDTVIDRFLNAPEESEGAREEFNVAAEMMADDRTLGVGLNQFSYALTNVERYRAHIKIMANEEQGGVAHHIYLLTAAEMGHIGLYLLLLFLARIILPVVFTGLRWKNINHLMLLGLTVGLGGALMIGFLEWVFRLTPVIYMFSITAGMGTALVTVEKEKRQRSRKAVAMDTT